MLDLLSEAGMLGCKLCDAPVDPKYKLKEDDDNKLLDVGRYQWLVGKLMYLASTYPNISFAVSLVSQFMHASTIVHLEVAYRILRYLKDLGLGLLYTANNALWVKTYTNANWAGLVLDWRSTSGYCMFIIGNLVTWRSKKQLVLKLSSGLWPMVFVNSSGFKVCLEIWGVWLKNP